MTGTLGWPMVDASCRVFLTSGCAEARRLACAPQTAVYRVRLRSRRQPRSAIVKLYTDRARWKAAKEHHVVTTLAGSTTFGVPRILASGPVPGTDVTVLILQDLGSLTLRGAVRSGRCWRPQALELLGHLLRNLHQRPYFPPASGYSIGTTTVPERVTMLRRRLPARLHADTDVALQQAIGLAGTRPRTWCHGDLHWDNLLLWPTGPAPRPYLIDFEQTTLAVAEYDLAQTVVTTDALDRGDQSRLLAGYGTAICSELLASLIVYQALRGWVWAAREENRDVPLWQTRVSLALDQHAGLIRPGTSTKGT